MVKSVNVYEIELEDFSYASQNSDLLESDERTAMNTLVDDLGSSPDFLPNPNVRVVSSVKNRFFDYLFPFDQPIKTQLWRSENIAIPVDFL